MRSPTATARGCRMSNQLSLADKAVKALAATEAIDADVDVETPERHIIWALKRQAQGQLADAFDRASMLALLAQDVRDKFKEVPRG